MNRFRGGFRRRQHRRARRYILQTIRKYGGSKRVLRRNFTATLSGVALTETQNNVFTAAADAPTDMITPESGSRLESLNLQCRSTDMNAGSITDVVLYVNAGGTNVPSTTPIADYWATTEPPSRDSNLIRKNKLRIAKIVLPVNATYPAVFSYKLRFRKAITFNQATTLVLGWRSTSLSKTFDCTVIAVFRK